ncbi:MAG: nicotinate (nicotinamide) nucleotide adenylyltransferase [Clostridia bacterium]|nr:nicotinate (nicotinamide) nucleotide adenylyltransferase [Clostridia bacterium]
MNKKVIAVFGGSFNPPINSHTTLAKQIIEKCSNIEKLIFVPVSTKYQKLKLENDEHRYNMLKLICQKEDKLEVSNIEMMQNRQLYTIETLDLLKEQCGENYEIWFVMGTDNLKQIGSWYNPERLLKEYKIIVLERENDRLENLVKDNKLLEKYKESFIKIEGIDKIFLSSTMIREKIRKGENIEEYIDRDVLEYIEKHNLYKNI